MQDEDENFSHRRLIPAVNGVSPSSWSDLCEIAKKHDSPIEICVHCDDLVDPLREKRAWSNVYNLYQDTSAGIPQSVIIIHDDGMDEDQDVDDEGVSVKVEHLMMTIIQTSSSAAALGLEEKKHVRILQGKAKVSVDGDDKGNDYKVKLSGQDVELDKDKELQAGKNLVDNPEEMQFYIMDMAGSKVVVSFARANHARSMELRAASIDKISFPNRNQEGKQGGDVDDTDKADPSLPPRSATDQNMWDLIM